MQFQKESTITNVLDQNTIEEAYGCLNKTILQEAEKKHPQGIFRSERRPPVTWWNKECEREERIVRVEYRNHQRDPTNRTKLISFQHRRAIKLRVFIIVKKFVNSLNSRTPTKKLWDKFKKLNGNYKPRIIQRLKRGGNTITSPNEIGNTFTDYYENISRPTHKKLGLGNTEKKELPYNKPFTGRKLKTAIKQQKNTALALTNILCKRFKRMTNKKLVWYLEKDKKIDERQFSFKIDAISKITRKILD